MIFYTIKLGERTLDYASTQVLAKQAVTTQQARYPGETITWGEEEVPTDKPGLLAWLKEHALGGEEEEF